jgi:glycosyltransferase involved in cell wall biosynthesis
MKQPQVTVCIPVFNGERFIERTIKSVLDQTFTDFELLIIDDASSDKTHEIINSFSDTRIKFLKSTHNLGLVSNWNRCLDNAQGEYIQFLHHDDYLPTNCLEKKVNAFNKDKDICLVFNATYIVNDQDIILMKRRPFKIDKLFDGEVIAHKSFVQKNVFGEPSNVMFKRESSKKVGYFDERLCYAVDWDYWFKLSLLGKVYYINDFLSYFRVSKTSVTTMLTKNKEKLINDDKQLVENCVKNSKFKITKLDIFLHKINTYLRMYARGIFIKINTKNV